MLAREPGEFESVRRGTRGAAAYQFEHRRVQIPVCARADMRQARDPFGVGNKRNRTSNVAQRPQCMREVKHRPDAGIYSKVKGQIVIATGLEQRERTLKTIARVDVLSGEQVGDPRGATGDSGLGRIGPRLDVIEECLGVRLHRRQLAPNIAAGPETVVGRQSFGGIIVAGR